jgi:uncharacterized membrane protein
MELVVSQKEEAQMKSGHNLVVVTFEEDSKAYEGLSKLNQADVAGRVGVMSAAVLHRDPDGRLSVPEATDAITGTGVAGGGLLGLLVGVIGGPVGALLGFSVGALAGSLFDLERADDEHDVLSQVAEHLTPGRTGLVAEVDEYAVEVIDGEMLQLGGTVVRIPAAEVLSALESAERAAKAAEREARRIMREEHKQQVKAKLVEIETKWEERVAALKEKVGS